MRRALSIFLVLFFAIGPLTALFGETDDARLPACCRRHGAHHCAMSEAAMAQVILATGQHIFTAPSHCPLYPQGAPAPTSSTHGLASVHAPANTLLAVGYRPRERRLAPANRPIRNLSVRGPPFRSFC